MHSKTYQPKIEIEYLQYINEKSELTQPLPKDINDQTLLKLYRTMSLTRTLDNKILNLQRTGKMGTYPCALGQEAIGTGVGYSMQANDIFCPSYREQATLIQRNISLLELLQYWGGFEQGNNYANNSQDLPICVPIATQCLHATGAAYAIKYQKQQRAVVAACGDGATSKGDFYEALNLAGTWKLPLVFVVNNNQWAISVPRKQQTAASTIAQKAIAGGVACMQVDGNDVVAVSDAVRYALEQARSGQGPMLIEAISYRLCDHTTVDDGSRYQPAAEVKAAWQQEPIARLAHYMQSQNLWSKQHEQTMQQELKAEVEAAVEQFKATPIPAATSMFDHLYAELPEALLDQYDQVGES